MFRSKFYFNRGLQALAGAVLLALLIAGILGITRVHAAAAATQAPGVASHGDSNICAAGLQSSDTYLRQEEAVLSKVTQSNWNVAEMASPSSSNSCAAGVQSNDDYLRQEEAVLRRVAQGNWTAAEMTALGGSQSSAAGLQSIDEYRLQEEAVLRIVTQSIWNPTEIASFGGDNFIALARR